VVEARYADMSDLRMAIPAEDIPPNQDSTSDACAYCQVDKRLEALTCALQILA
jgi:hypothetical protein